jgi:sporulation protein YlmC with PRC-barrel domain
MEITIGDPVHGRDGELGSVERFLIDPRTHTVEHIVVNPGVFQDERIVPLDQIHGLADGVIGVDFGSEEFKSCEVYSDSVYHGRSRHDSGPPAYGNTTTSRGEFMMDETSALGSTAFMTGKPMGYPGDEQTVSDDEQFPSVAHGTEVVDVDGEKVGDVGSITVDATRGVPARFTLRRGLIFSNETEVPIAWFDRVLPGRVVLKVTKDQVDALAEAA